MKATVFFSWQSDIRAAACRTLIESALEAAATTIATDDSLAIEPVIDRDTQNVPGAPDIGATILSKIDAAAVFVADVTIVGETRSGKPTPNPNVLVELGYALKTLGWSRVVLVQNTAFGGPEVLPFDLRQKRALVFSSAKDAGDRASERRALQGKFGLALREILMLPVRADDASETLQAFKSEVERIGSVAQDRNAQQAWSRLVGVRYGAALFETLLVRVYASIVANAVLRDDINDLRSWIDDANGIAATLSPSTHPNEWQISDFMQRSKEATRNILMLAERVSAGLETILRPR